MTATTTLFFHNIQWMRWNLFLAIIPLILSGILFLNPSLQDSETLQESRKLHRNFWWWLGVAIFTLFLPNAAYIITDIIHFVDDLRDSRVSSNGIIFVIIPQYIIFLIVGFQCHVISLMNLGQYLQRKVLINQIIAVELAVNFICAFGIYLGRFNRLNSWNIVTQPYHLMDKIIDNLDQLHFFLITLLFFVVISFLYYLFKWLNLSIWYGWQNFSKKY